MKVLELVIVPDIDGESTDASLENLRLAESELGSTRKYLIKGPFPFVSRT